MTDTTNTGGALPLGGAKPNTVSSKPNFRFPVIDEIRGIAVLMVYLCHTMLVAFSKDSTHTLGFKALYIFNYGHLGVAVFFALSGFCVHLSHAVGPDSGSWARYAVRRWFRIYPPYLVALLFFAFVLPHTADSLAAGGPQLISHLLLGHNFSDQTIFGVSNHFWTIAVEAQLYALLPILCWFAARNPWRWTGVLVAAGVIEVVLRLPWSHLAPQFAPPFALIKSPLGYILSWSAGAAVAQALVEKTAPPFSRIPALVWAALAVVCAEVPVLEGYSFLAAALCSATIIRSGVFGNRSTFIRALPRVVTAHIQETGKCGYSIYLWHVVFMHVAGSWYWKQSLLPKHSLIAFAMMILLWPLSYLVGRASFATLETPFNRLGSRIAAWIPRKG